MKIAKEILRNGISPSEYSRAPHTVCLSDFDTNHPCANRIERIASEINEYMKWKRKCAEVSK